LKKIILALVCLFLLTIMPASANNPLEAEVIFISQTATSGFDTLQLLVYSTNGERLVKSIDGDIIINQRSFSSAERAQRALENARVALYYYNPENDTVYISFSAQSTQKSGITASEIDSSLPLFYQENGDFYPPCLNDGLRYDVDCYADATVITHMYHPGNKNVVATPAIDIVPNIEYQTIHVDPTFIDGVGTLSWGNYTAELVGTTPSQMQAIGNEGNAHFTVPNADGTYTIRITPDGDGVAQDYSVEVSASPVYTAYLMAYEEAGGFSDGFDLLFASPDGSTAIRSFYDMVYMNSLRYPLGNDEKRESVINALDTMTVFQYQLDKDGNICAIYHSTEPTQSGIFSSEELPDDRELFLLIGYDDRDFPVFATPYRSEGYTYEAQIYPEGVLITDMSCDNADAAILACDIDVFANFTHTAIEVMPTLSGNYDEITATLTGNGINQTQSGTDYIYFEGLPNQDATYSLTLQTCAQNQRSFTVETHPADIKTAYINQCEEDGGFTSNVNIEVFMDGKQTLLTTTNQTRINGVRYRNQNDLLANIPLGRTVQLLCDEEGIVTHLRFSGEPTEYTAQGYSSQHGFSNDNIAKNLPVIALKNMDMPSDTYTFEPYLADGFLYDLIVYDEAIIVTDISHSSFSSIIEEISAYATISFSTRSIVVDPVFSGDHPGMVTARLYNGQALLDEISIFGEDTIQFFNLPNTAATYTVQVGAENSNTRTINVSITPITLESGALGMVVPIQLDDYGVRHLISILTNGKLITYLLAEGVLPPAGLENASQNNMSLSSVSTMPVVETPRGQVKYLLNDAGEISYIRYVQPVVIHNITEEEGETTLSYTLSVENTNQNQTETIPIVAIYRGEKLLSVAVHDTTEMGENCIVSGNITVSGSAESLSIRPFWWNNLSTLSPSIIK